MLAMALVCPGDIAATGIARAVESAGTDKKLGSKNVSAEPPRGEIMD